MELEPAWSVALPMRAALLLGVALQRLVQRLSLAALTAAVWPALKKKMGI
jgi:hypothetical protein